jgi:hypothetical protein
MKQIKDDFTEEEILEEVIAISDKYIQKIKSQKVIHIQDINISAAFVETLVSTAAKAETASKQKNKRAFKQCIKPGEEHRSDHLKNKKE